MLHILGVGASAGQQVLSDDFFGAAPLSAQSTRFGVKSRRTTLPLEYIAATGNADILVGRKTSLATPTTLAVEASRIALERAGITAEQLGLIIGDCSTPYETCPSEAQRVGGVFGVKIPAYDLVVGPGALPVYLETLLSWQEARIPDYVLCLSTNTPTQQVDYRAKGIEGCVFGDCAGAFVISPRHDGPFAVKYSHLQKVPRRSPPMVVERHIQLRAEGLPSTEEMKELCSTMLTRLEQQAGLNRSKAWMIGPQLLSGEFPQIASDLGMSKERVVTVTAETGFALGASPIAALDALWNTTDSGDQIAIVHAGDGYWSGSLMLVRR